MNGSNHRRLGERREPTLFRPSVYERPVLRVRYITQEGLTEQSTLSSSWHSQGDVRNPDSTREAIGKAFTVFYESLGCQVTHIEWVNRTITEMLANA